MHIRLFCRLKQENLCNSFSLKFIFQPHKNGIKHVELITKLVTKLCVKFLGVIELQKFPHKSPNFIKYNPIYHLLNGRLKIC